MELNASLASIAYWEFDEGVLGGAIHVECGLEKPWTRGWFVSRLHPVVWTSQTEKNKIKSKFRIWYLKILLVIFFNETCFHLVVNQIFSAVFTCSKCQRVISDSQNTAGVQTHSVFFFLCQLQLPSSKGCHDIRPEPLLCFSSHTQNFRLWHFQDGLEVRNVQIYTI